MTPITIQKEIFIDDSRNDYTFTGYVILKSTNSVKIDKVKGFIFFE